MKPKFKYLLQGNHPCFKKIKRRCLTKAEAENVIRGLTAIGYKISITEIKE